MMVRDEAWFMAKVVKDESGCWLWQGRLNQEGYGVFSVRIGVRKNRHCYAHRFAYEFAIGPIPKGMTIDHLCRVRNCVNPAHLEAISLRENILRGEAPAARNARKTHCPKGHPYSGDNLYIRRSGFRMCRACSSASSLRRWRKSLATAPGGEA